VEFSPAPVTANDVDDIDAWLPDLLHLTHPRAPEITRDFIGKRKNEHTQTAYARILRAFLQWAERSELETRAALTTADKATTSKVSNAARRRRRNRCQTARGPRRSRICADSSMRWYAAVRFPTIRQLPPKTIASMPSSGIISRWSLTKWAAFWTASTARSSATTAP